MPEQQSLPDVGEPSDLGTNALGAIRGLLASGGPVMHYQPQFSLTKLEICGYEALARFPAPWERCEPWFAKAQELGLGACLETAAVANALRGGVGRPEGTLLAVNVSPSVLGHPSLEAVLPADLHGFELELTEHEALVDPEDLLRQLDALRERGARIAVDDVGAGHSGLNRIMQLRPDSLKLDRHLVVGVSSDSAKAALIRAVVEFAEHLGATVCAEGVETVADLLTLADLDVSMAQGWLIGRGDSVFAAIDPYVAEVCQRSLKQVLSFPSRTSADGRFRPAVSLEDLLGQLADVSALDDLAALVHRAAVVLGCSQMTLSFLNDRDGNDRDGNDQHGAVQAVSGSTVWQCNGRPFQLDAYPLTRQCQQDRSVIPVYDIPGQCEAERAVLQELGHHSVLLVPVTSRNRAVGLLECYLHERTPWSRRQIRAARLLASVLGPVLDGLLGSSSSR
jgi:EAL domain-containing protein (putative c-di-GMP-specific phosphodiesterase class I)